MYFYKKFFAIMICLLSCYALSAIDHIENLEGVLEIRAAFDHVARKEIIEYVLDNNGVFYYLHFNDKVPTDMASGDRILLRYATMIPGRNDGKHLLVLADDFLITSKAQVSLGSFGPQRTIVFLVNFQDQPTSKPWTLEQINTNVFTTMNNMFYESSYNQTTVVGQVIGWYTLPMNGNLPCTTFTDSVAKMSETAAQNAGVDLSIYKRRIYMFPRNNNCSWSGLGTVGTPGAYSKTWMNGYNIYYIIGHELGHNFGLYHSRRITCTQGSNTGTCTTSDYGDGGDIMGSGQSAHFNAFQKENLGWLNYQNSPPIQTITGSGTYNIYPYELANKDVKALKILKQINADGSKDYYYLEFRQNIGFDAPLASCSNMSCDYTKGILVHQGNNTKANSSDLLDMSPFDNNANKIALLPGQSFSDPNAGLTITVQSIQASGASVNITLAN